MKYFRKNKTKPKIQKIKSRNGELIRDSTKIATTFNKYFIDVGKTLAS